MVAGRGLEVAMRMGVRVLMGVALLTIRDAAVIRMVVRYERWSIS